MKTAWGWSAKLTRLIVLKDGTRLVTLGDVRAFIQPEHIQERGSWQHATELPILAAERGGNIEAATSQMSSACQKSGIPLFGSPGNILRVSLYLPTLCSAISLPLSIRVPFL
jgi:hypothetical protein